VVGTTAAYLRSKAGHSEGHFTVMRRLTTGIRSEKCVVRRFRRCANVTVYLHKPRYYTKVK